MTINYTVIGVQRSFGAPGVVGPNGEAVQPPATYNATLQLTNTGQFMGMSQFTITIGPEKLALYQLDAQGVITIADPAPAKSVPQAEQTR